MKFKKRGAKTKVKKGNKLVRKARQDKLLKIELTFLVITVLFSLFGFALISYNGDVSNTVTGFSSFEIYPEEPATDVPEQENFNITPIVEEPSAGDIGTNGSDIGILPIYEEIIPVKNESSDFEILPVENLTAQIGNESGFGILPINETNETIPNVTIPTQEGTFSFSVENFIPVKYCIDEPEKHKNDLLRRGTCIVQTELDKLYPCLLQPDLTIVCELNEELVNEIENAGYDLSGFNNKFGISEQGELKGLKIIRSSRLDEFQVQQIGTLGPADWNSSAGRKMADLAVLGANSGVLYSTPSGVGNLRFLKATQIILGPDVGQRGQIQIGFSTNVFQVIDFYYGTPYNVSIDNNVTLTNLHTTQNSSNMVGYWKFTTNANDDSGNANHGTVTGATHVHESYSFDGVNDEINATPTIPLQQNISTVSIWFKPQNTITTSTTAQNIIGFGPTLSGICLGSCAAGLTNEVISFVTENVLREGWCLAGGTISNNWHNVVTVWNGTNHNIYLDNVKIDNCITGTLSTLQVNYTEIGATTGQRFFNGTIDEVIIYNISLSATDIANLYLSGLYHTVDKGEAYLDSGVLDMQQYNRVRDIAFTCVNDSYSNCSLSYRMGNYSKIDLTDTGLVSYWNLSDAESSLEFMDSYAGTYPNGNNGTCSGMGCPNRTAGIFEADAGMKFDGVDDYISIPNSPSINANSSNSSAWSSWFFAKIGTTQGIMRSNDGLSANGLQYLMDCGNYGSSLTCYTRTTGSGVVGMSCSTTYTSSAWHFGVCNWNGTTLSVYVDGVYCNSISATGVRVNSTLNTLIGAEAVNTRFFNGTIDSVAIWNRSLSAGEISALYHTNTTAWTTKSYSPNININTQGGRTLQYRAYLESSNTTSNPYLTNVTLYYNNSAPTIGNISITPATAYTNSTLNCTTYAYDVDLDALNINITWYNGTSAYESVLISSISNGTMVSDILTASIQAKNEVWNCTAFANDTYQLSAENSTTITISNLAPVITPQPGSHIPVNNSEMVGYWRFDTINSTNQTLDLTQNNNFGNVSGAINTFEGRVGKGFSFDGLNDGISLSQNIRMNNISSAISLWFKTDFGSTSSTSGIMVGNNPDTDTYIYAFNPTTIKIQSDQGGTLKSYTVPTINSGVWYHLVVIRDSGNASVYINGQQSSSGPQVIPYNLTINEIGKYGSGAVGFWYSGSIDEVIIYNRSLSSTEIASIYNSTRGAYGIYTNYDLGCGMNTSDVDLENMTMYEIKWYNNSVLMTTLANLSDIDAGNTTRLENWSCEVRTFDSTDFSSWVNSSNLSIMNSAPTQETPILNSTLGTNTTSENLTCYNQSTIDADSDNVKNIYNWYKNNQSIMLLNMPFEANGSETTVSKDYSGYGNDGTVSGATFSSTAGYDGKGAYSFDGINDFTNVTAGQIIGTGNVSVCSWIYAKNWGGGTCGRIMDNGKFLFTICQSVGQLYCSSDGSTSPASAVNSILLNSWYHACVTRSSTGSVNFYVNGLLSGTANQNSGTPASGTTNLYIGNRKAGDRAFNGTIDEVKIYNYSLSANEIVLLYQNSTHIIHSDATTKGENWTCSVTPNDGYQDGSTLNSSSLTILNTAPTTPTIGNPANASRQTGNSVTLNCGSSTDTDGDTINYEFYGNEITNPPTTLLQNTTTATYVLATGDGKTYWWRCRANDALENSAYTTIKQFVENNLSLVTSIAIDPATVYTNSTLNGSAVVIDSDGDALTIYQNWTNGTAHYSAYTKESVSSGSTINFTLTPVGIQVKNEVWNFTTRIYDGYELSLFNSTTITISNIGPTMGNVSITPTTAYTNSTLNCTTYAYDIDLDTMSVNITWYNGTAAYESVLISSISNGSMVSDTLTAGVQFKNEVWNCTAFANDGTADSATNSTAITILNSIPLIDIPTIAPAAPYTIHHLNCSTTSYDSDLDSLTVNITWWNGTTTHTSINIATTNGTQVSYTLDHANTTSGDNWNCSTMANDGTSNSLQTSRNVTILGIDLTSCNNLSIANETYYLKNNVSTTVTCFKINVSNATLDCLGYTIDGDDSGSDDGISLSKSNNTIIRNCTITDFNDGISLSSSYYNNILNCTVNSNNDEAIYLTGSGNNNITNCTTNNNTDYGIGIRLRGSSHNNIVTGCTSNYNLWGFEVELSSGNTIINSVATGSATNPLLNVEGIYVYDSNNTNVTNNTFTENKGYDIYYYASSVSYCSNIIENNTGSGNRPIKYYNSSATLSNETISELIMCNAKNANISNVTIDGSATLQNNGALIYFTNNSNFTNINSSDNYIGISLTSSLGNIFSNITTNLNYNYGVYLSSSNNTQFSFNTAKYNQYGFWLQSGSSNNTFANTTVQNNSVWDFYSKTNSLNNTITALTTYNSTISFTSLDVAIKGIQNSLPSDPGGKSNIGKWLNITNNSANSWIYLNISYTDADISNSNINASRISEMKILRYKDEWYDSGFYTTNGIDQDNKLIYANITSFSIFAPLTPTLVIATPETPTGPGGSGSSGGGSSKSRESQETTVTGTSLYLPYLAPAPLKIIPDDPNLAVYEIIIEIAKEVENVKINVKEPSIVDIEKPGLEVFKYIEITKENLPDSFISEVYLKFKVPKSAVKDRELSLYHYTDSWSKLRTKLIKSDELFNYYESISPSLNYFAITLSEKPTSLIFRLKPKVIIEKLEFIKQQIETNYILIIVIASLIILVIVVRWKLKK